MAGPWGHWTVMAHASEKRTQLRGLYVYQRLPMETACKKVGVPRSTANRWKRSSRSIGANISEAWAKRRYPAHFTSKLTDADGELQETQHWLLRAHAYSYIPKAHLDTLMERALRIGRRLGRMMQFDNW